MAFSRFFRRHSLPAELGACILGLVVIVHAQAVNPDRHPVAVSNEIRAIYLTGPMAGSAHGRELVEQWRQAGGNAVVFDIKDGSEPVSFNTGLALATHLRHPYISNLPAYVAWLHHHGLYVIARMTLFKDEPLAKAHPDLAVRSRATGGVWTEHGLAAYLDPSLPAVQNYNIALAQYTAEAGVDEIQFDYIRFPVNGRQKDARFAYQAHNPQEPRADIITGFLRQAQQALKPSGVRISIDLYGIAGWQRKADLAMTGQDVARLAQYCDVICPMIYPSHFFDRFDGFAHPSAHPQHFIQAGMERFQKITHGEPVVIRPWLQAFRWLTPTFNEDYIRVQVATEHAQGGGGFMLWNAGNIYKVPFAAMPAMRAEAGKYFTGGYPYAVIATPPAASAGPNGRE